MLEMVVPANVPQLADELIDHPIYHAGGGPFFDDRAALYSRFASHLAELLRHSAMATLKLFQQRGEMWRDGMVDRIVPGPQPSPDFPQPRAAAQDVARFGSVQLTMPTLALTNARGLAACSHVRSTAEYEAPISAQNVCEIYGISRHVELVFTIFFDDRAFSGSSPNARARYMSASLQY
jgi:hypothetical protein